MGLLVYFRQNEFPLSHSPELNSGLREKRLFQQAT